MNNFTKAFYTTKSKSIQWVFAILTVFLLNSQQSFGQRYWRIDGTSATLTSSSWSTTGVAPFTSAWSNGSNIIFQANSAITNVTNTPVGNLTINPGFTVTWTQAGTFSTGGGVRTFDIGAGSTLTWNGQSVATTAGTGFIKSGAGTWNIGAQGNAYPGGFTLSAGNVIAGGTNALGSGGTLALNGGVLMPNSGTARNFAGKFTSMTIGGDFQFGDAANFAGNSGALSFDTNIGLGAATRTITIGGVANYSLSGIISGSAGSGLTVAAVPTTGTGTLVLSGVNTYTGDTTISSGNLSLSGSGSIAASPVITVGSGANFSIASRSAALTLATGQVLRSSATGANATATVTVGATPTLTVSTGGVAFTAYGGGGTAPMTVAGAGGTLDVTGPVSVTTTTSLAAGTYKLIAKSGSATVTGTPGTLTIAGSGISGTGSLSIVAGELFLTVTASGSLTVTYNGNSNTGGTVPTDSNTYTSGDPVSTLGNTGTLTRTNFDFSGWNTLATGLGTSYTAPQASAFNISANTTLYAKWTGTVTYNGNGNTGGTAPTAATGVIAGDTYTVAANPGALTNTGFTFGGWNTQADGLGTNYASGTGFFAFAGNITLYAKWNAVVTYTVTYNGNSNTGGTVPTDGTAYSSGDPVSTLGNTGTLTRTNFDFSGWNTLATGLGTNYTAPQASAFNISANTTIYAKWTGTVTYNGNGNTGGTAPSAATGVIAGATYTVANNTGALVNTGFVFGGWNTQADGLGTNYTAGSGTFPFAGNITLYAKWNSGPCLTEDFAGLARPSGWTDSAASGTISYSGATASMAVTTGTITMVAVANPGSMTFDLSRTSNTNAKNLNIEVSTTSQSSGFSVVTNYDHGNTVSNGTTACTVDLSAYSGSSTVYIRFNKTSGTTSAWTLDNINVYCVNPATISTLAAYGSQPSGNIASGTNDAVLAGFSVTPGSSANFTSVTLTGTSTAPSDISNVRIFRDNNGNGVIDGADASVSGAGIAFANGNLSAMTITGETGFSTVRNYIVVADVSASPTSTSVGVEIGSGNFVTSLATNSGSMAINTRNITVPTSTLAQYVTQLSGSIAKGTSNVPVAGFTVTPTSATTFSAVTITGSGAAVPGDITLVRIFKDNDGNGAINGADASVSGAGVAFVNGAISITGMSESISTATSYLIVANVSGAATSTTFGVAIGSGAFTTGLSNVGSMAVVNRALTNSAASNIIRSTGFTEPTNLAYGTYQTTNITAAGAGVGNIKIAEFTIQDGGGSNDGDGLGTILNSVTFTVGNSANVRRLALYDNTGTAFVGTEQAGAASVTFSGLTLTAADNGSKTFSVYASFNTAVTDNQNIGLTVSAATASTSGSGFAAGNAGAAASVVTGNTNKIVVTATKLLFGTVPGGSINVNLTAFTVSTTDANNNIDTDVNALSVTLGTDGTGATLSNPHTITAGTVSISTVQFSNPQSGIKLTASASGYSTVDSNTFIISSYPEGTWRTLTSGTWSSSGNNVNATATFERIVSGAWVAQGNYGTSPFAPIQAPTSGSANQVIIANNILLVGSNTHKNIVIESGGVLGSNGVSATFGSLLVKTGGTFNKTSNGVGFDSTGTFEVEDGATFTYSHTNTTSRSTSIWNGTEVFHPNSNFEILVSDGGTGTAIIQSATDISEYTDTSNGNYKACFGNIIINCSTGGLDLVPAGFTRNLTHGNLILRTSSDNAPLFVGAFNTTIGGNIVIESTYNQNATIMNTGTTGVLNVKGSITHSAPRTFTLVNNAAGNMTVNVDGDVTINPATTGTLNVSGNTTGICALNIKGDLTVNTNGIISAVGTTTSNNVITFNGTGNGSTAALTQSVNVGSTAATENNNIAYVVENGSYTQLAADLELGNGGTFTVKTGGTLDFGFSGATTTAFNVTERPGGPTGTTVFTTQTGTTLRITSAGGIMAAPAASGNVLLDSRSFAQNGCTFNYVGRANQVTGDIFTTGSTSKTIICDLDTSALTLTLSVPTQTSTLLNIKKGIFVESNTNNLSGGGALTIDATGTYRSAIVTATGNFPQLTGTRTFASGSTIELNAAASTEQTLRGGLDYKNLIFSNGGTKKLSSATAQIDGTVTIKDAAIVDAETNTFGDYLTTTLAMTDTSRLILSKAATVPDMGRFNLTGGTIEFAGNSNLHRMRGPIYSSLSPDIDTAYNNVVISGANVNGGSGNYTFRNGATFTVDSGARMSVTNQELQADTAAAVAVNINGTFATADIHGFSGDNDSSINPTGITINLGATSTVEYNGTAAQVLSSRSDYKNLTIDNSLNTGTRGVTANGDVTFSGALALTDGLVNTGSFTVIGTATSTTTVGTGWVNGNFRKFIASGSTSRDFEIGSSTVYAPVSLAFTGTISASTGSITATTTNGDHPQVATSGFNTSKTVNRYYTLTNDTAVPGLTSYSPTFTYVAGDNDVAATPADYVIRRYSGTWSTSSISGTPTNTSATTTGVTGFGDFAIGENKITPTVVVNLAPSYTYISDPQGPNSLVSPTSPAPTALVYSYEGTGATVYGPSATRPENAGTYQVTVTLNEDANYYAAAPVTENFTILQKELTLIDLGTNNKVYDATTDASFTIVPAGPGVPGTRLAGIIPGDTVGFTPAGYFFDGAAPVSNVGTWTIISTTTLNGAESANYFLTQPIFGAQKDITPLGLTVSGFTASNKPYDGNRDATVSVAGVSLVGVLGGQSVTLDSGSVTGLFDTKDIGTGKTVTASGFFITGPDASNYALTQPTTTANITTVPLTITADALSSCAGTFVTTGRTEFTKSVNVLGDITTVTLTPSPGDGSTPGDYTLTPSAAAGPGVGNYGPITYVAGTLHVNRTPTATIGGTATICLNEAQPSITFTGANGEGTVHYRFYYRLNGGAELFRDSDPGVSTASFPVSTATTRIDTYTLTRVLDLNTGCEQAQTGSAVMTIGLCTQVRPLQCGLTLPALDTPIQASPLPGATQYTFEVTRVDTNTTYPLINSSTYFFYPATQIPGGFLYTRSYSIRVKVIIGGVEYAYGNYCTVTAPNTPTVAATKIRPNQCGATLTTVSTAIEASPVFLATQYQFEVTPQGGSAVVVTTSSYFFSLTGTPGLAAYSKAYAIRVNAFSGGNWTGFGDTCIVTTPAQPSTRLITSQCGATFTNLTFTLNSSNVPLVTKYRFRVVNGPTTRIAEVSRNYIVPSDLAGGYANNTVYTVDVATLYNGLWSSYGPACTVTTPFIRMASQDINTNVFEVKAFPNPFARHFSLDIQSSSDDLVQVQVYDMLGRALEVQKATVSELSTKEIGTNYPSGVYNVVVSQGDKVRSVRMIKR